MTDLDSHNRSEWRQNRHDLIAALTVEPYAEQMLRWLLCPPLDRRVVDGLVQARNEGVTRELSRAIDEALDGYEAALRAMFGATRMLAAAVALPCRYCGEQSCDRRDEHERMYRASETTIREQASRPANPPSAPKSAALGGDGAAGLLPHGPAAHPYVNDARWLPVGFALLKALPRFVAGDRKGDVSVLAAAVLTALDAAHQTPAGASSPSNAAGSGVVGPDEGDGPATPAGDEPVPLGDRIDQHGGWQGIAKAAEKRARGRSL